MVTIEGVYAPRGHYAGEVPKTGHPLEVSFIAGPKRFPIISVSPNLSKGTDGVCVHSRLLKAKGAKISSYLRPCLFSYACPGPAGVNLNVE